MSQLLPSTRALSPTFVLHQHSPKKQSGQSSGLQVQKGMPLHTAILGAGISKALLAAGVKARVGGEGRRRHIDLEIQGTSTRGIIVVAAEGLIIVRGDVGRALGEGGILVDREDIVATADLVGIASAGLLAFGGVDGGRLEEGAAVADAVVLETGVSVAVAWKYV